MHIQIPHGRDMLGITVNASQVAGVPLPRALSPAPHPGALLRQAVQAAVEERGVADKPGPNAKACIAITDRTRSTPNSVILPILLDHLNALGVPDRNITVISGSGMHAADSPGELARNVGRSVLQRVEVVTNEPDNDAIMVHLGTSDLDTPVELRRRFAEADIKLGVINVNPCRLAGWSGGGKIVQPAIASRRSIYHNHKFFVQPLMELRCASLMGVMPPDNPVRADLEQCAAISGIDLVVNTVLDSQRQLADVFCGQHVEAHRADELTEIHLDHAPSAELQRTVDDATGSYGDGASIGVMPYAGLALPLLAAHRGKS